MELFKLLKGEPSMSSAFKKPSDVGEAICAAVSCREREIMRVLNCTSNEYLNHISLTMKRPAAFPS